MKPCLSLTIATVLFVTSHVTFAEPTILDVEPVRVSMFKNGLAMVTSRTQVPGPGQYQLPAPDARYGSLWLSWDGGLKLDQIISTEIDRVEPILVTTVRELLLANVGQPVTIRMSRGEGWISGKLIEPPDSDEVSAENREWYLEDTGIFFFQTDEGTMVLDLDLVDAARFESGGWNTTLPEKESQQVLKFDAAKADGDGTGLKMGYLAQGIAWSPSYVLELLEEGQARLTCKAVIVNDLMDLDNVDVELIAGFPNLRFAGAPSAMSWRSLDDLLELLQSGEVDYETPPSNSRRYGGGGGGIFGDSEGSDYDTYKPIAGEDTEDLYFYQLGDVTLAKDERGYFPMFSADVPCRDVYTWDIGDYIDERDRYQGSDESPQDVWHSLELTNTTDQPWTTAPGMTVKDGRVLGQDMLNFTPPSGTSVLKITQAISIDAQQNEVEVDRIRNAEKFHGSTYDRVTVEGTLSITNYKDETVTIKINKAVSGEVESADGGPEVVKLASGLRRVNPRSKLTWEAEVPPGREQAVKIVYRYSFYAR